MKSIIFSTVFAVTTLTAFAASAQTAGFNGTINQQQALDTSAAQRIICQVRPANRACSTRPGGQQRESGNRRTGQQGGQARP